MLRLPNRLSKLSDIQRVLKNGRYSHAPDFGIKFLQNQKGSTRMTVVVSTKISKKAVARNKIKRRIREIIKKEIMPHIKNGYDVIVMTKKSVLESDFSKMKKDTIKLFKKSKLINYDKKNISSGD